MAVASIRDRAQHAAPLPFSRYRILFLWLAAGILLVGFALRLLLYDYHGLEGDDAFSLSLSRLPVEALLPGLMAFELDIHPPLHFLLLKGWTSMAGESLLSLRLLNYLMDVLIGALLLRLAGRSLSRRAALVAGIFWVIAPLLLASDLLVRMYTLLALLATAGSVCIIEGWRARGWRRTALYLALGLCALAAMYTHMLGFIVTAVFAVGVVAGEMLRFQRWRSISTHYAHAVGAQRAAPLPATSTHIMRRASLRLTPTGFEHVRNIAFALLPLLIAGILSLPYAQALWTLYRSGRPLGAEINPLAAFSSVAVPDLVLSTLLTGRAWMLLPFVTPSVITIAIVLVCLRYRARALPLALMGAAGIVAMIALAWLADLYKPRYLTPFLPPLLALLAGAALLPRRALWRGALVLSVALLSGAGLLADFDRTLRDDWIAAGQFVETYEQPGDVIIVIPDWGGAAFDYHYDGAAQVTSLLPGVSAEIDLDSLLSPLVEGRSRVWLVLYQPLVTDSAGLVDAWFRSRAVPMTEVYPSGIQVRLYDFDPFLNVVPEHARPLDAEFGGLLALRGAYLPVTSGSASESRLHPPSNWVYVELYWESLQAGADAFPRVRFTDGIGQVYGEALPRDNGLLTQYPVSSWGEGQIVRASYDLNLNPTTPPGAYNIEVMVLDAATGAPLPSTGADAGAQWAIAGQYTVR